MTQGLGQVTRCALCGSGERRELFREEQFQLMRCSACGLVYTTPRLTPEQLLDRVYNESYWASASPKEQGYADYVAEASFYRRTFRRRLRHVERFTGAPGKVLDIGCAAGFFLQEAAARGWDPWGIEPSEAIVGVARSRLPGAQIHQGCIEDDPFPRGGFDLVTLWDVVEHTPDPVDFVGRAAAMVRPGGVLVLETQNVDSLFARLLGKRWQHFKHQEHLYHFNPHTLRRLLAGEAGLEVLHRTSRFGGKYVSPAFIAERAGRVHPLFSRLLAPLSGLKNQGLYINLHDELIFVCRRRPEGGS